MTKYFKLLRFAEQWYPPKKLQHACRVSALSFEDGRNYMTVNDKQAAMVGLAHDLLEDTDAPVEELEAIIGTELLTEVLLLSKDDNESYQDYIMNIINNKEDHPLAFLVKRADMKDHMSRMDTLTDKLKDKYLPVLHYFL